MARCPDTTHTTSPGQSPVMHLPLWLFSGNSALSRPSVLKGHWCWPKPSMSASLLEILKSVCFFSHLMRKRNVSPPHRTNPSLTIRPQMFQQELGAIHLSCIFWLCLDYIWEDSPRMLKHVSHADRPLSFPRRIPFYCSFTSQSPWRDSPSLFNGCWSLYHFDGSVKSRLVERMRSLWPKTQTGDSPNKKKKKKRKGKLFWGERSSEDRVRCGCFFLPASIPSITGLLQFPSHSAGVHSAAVASNRHLRRPRVVVILFFIFLFPSIQSK